MVTEHFLRQLSKRCLIPSMLAASSISLATTTTNEVNLLLDETLVSDEGDIMLVYKVDPVLQGHKCFGIASISAVIEHEEPIAFDTVDVEEVALAESGSGATGDMGASLIAGDEGVPIYTETKVLWSNDSLLDSSNNIDSSSVITECSASGDINTVGSVVTAHATWTAADANIDWTVEIPANHELIDGYSAISNDAGASIASLEIKGFIARRDNGVWYEVNSVTSFADGLNEVEEEPELPKPSMAWSYPGYQTNTSSYDIPAVISYENNVIGCLAENDGYGNYACIYTQSGDLEGEFPARINLANPNLAILECGSEADFLAPEEDTAEPYVRVNLEMQTGSSGIGIPHHWCENSNRLLRKNVDLISLTGHSWIVSQNLFSGKFECMVSGGLCADRNVTSSIPTVENLSSLDLLTVELKEINSQKACDKNGTAVFCPSEFDTAENWDDVYSAMNEQFYDLPTSGSGARVFTDYLTDAFNPVFDSDYLDDFIANNKLCDGKLATIVIETSGLTTNGTSGDDIIFGSNGADVINGNGGVDIICGNNGDDIITVGNTAGSRVFGGYGWDTINGGSAKDFLYGNHGKDSINGNGGNDEIYGGEHDDTLYGNEGNDTIYGQGGNDTIFGGVGIDTVYAGLGDDYVEGNQGGDFLYGEDGNDTIKGGLWHDRIEGGNGNDNLQGNDGIDAIFGDAGTDQIYGGDGDDLLYGGADTDQIFGDAGNNYIEGNDGNDELNGGNNNDTILGGAGEDLIKGNDGNDILKGGKGHDEIHGGNGDDVIEGNEHSDTLYGNHGEDTIYGGQGYDHIEGGEHSDILYGGTEDDRIWGNDYRDKLYGNEGNDELYGGDGKDDLDGGPGDDDCNGGNADDDFTNC